MAAYPAALLLAVFGDLHGNLIGAYDAVAHWEHNTGQAIEAILQVGDLGAIHDARKIDGATHRHFRRDPTELGGLLYLHGLLDPTHPTYFVRGNHEDFDYLLERKGEPVDPSGLLVHLWGTKPVTLEGDDGATCRIGGLGGVDGSLVSPKRQRARAGREYFHEEELVALEGMGEGELDILLTHDGPKGHCLVRDPGAGSQAITKLIERLQPRVHFFGHYGGAPPAFQLGRTRVFPMDGRGEWSVPGRHAAMGIIDTTDWSFRFIEPSAVDAAPPDCLCCHDVERASDLVLDFLEREGIEFTPETGWTLPAWMREKDSKEDGDDQAP